MNQPIYQLMVVNSLRLGGHEQQVIDARRIHGGLSERGGDGRRGPGADTSGVGEGHAIDGGFSIRDLPGFSSVFGNR